MAREARAQITFLYVGIVVFVLIPQTEASVVRVRRQGCQHGFYDHEGKSCCNCPAGYRVEADCTDQAQARCEACVAGTEYQSHDNSQKTCEPCTSCLQPNANLEVEEKCTPVSDATCKCKENHYCPDGAAPCKICEPCHACGSDGIKTPCSAINNTVCNDKAQDNTAAILCGVLVPLVLACVGAAFYIYKKRNSGNNILSQQSERSEETVPLQTNLGPLGQHIPEIAEIIGWPTVRNLAMKSDIPRGRIQGIELDHPKDSVERTIELLNVWEEKESGEASQKLLQYLRDTHQNNTADKVQEKLQRDCAGS